VRSTARKKHFPFIPGFVGRDFHPTAGEP